MEKVKILPFPAVKSCLFIFSLGMEKLREIFDREQISVDILAEMNHEDLKQVS